MTEDLSLTAEETLAAEKIFGDRKFPAKRYVKALAPQALSVDCLALVRYRACGPVTYSTVP